MTEDYDENEHVKETYAHFGLAYYAGSVLEEGLALATVTLDFLQRKANELSGRSISSVERKDFEEQYDAFIEEQHALTLGNLIRRLERLSVPEELKRDYAVAKKTRDFLAHHFWRERAEDFMTRRGRDSMIAELEAARDTFFGLERFRFNLVHILRLRRSLRTRQV